MAVGAYVLVVDDDPQITSLLHIALRRDGWQVRETHSGTQALNTARRTPPDAMLLDLRLPDMNGRAVMRHMGADPALARVPVIITTGDSEAARVPGAFTTLYKPFGLRALCDAVRAAVNGACKS